MKKNAQTILLIVLMLLFIGSAGVVQKRLIRIQRETGMTRADPLTDSPPLVAFTTVVLGGFRGLIADALWIRASRMQEEGRYFELVQLAGWITQLEPRFAEVWAFHAWNLSYNISVLFSDPEDRWRWIQSGIALLRDDGLRYNPADAQLYFELAWLYHHKIGGDTDRHNTYYRQQLANAMQQVLEDRESARSQGLDPDLMRRLQQQYGPLNWHLPETHAIYWAMQGLPYATRSQKLQLRRIIFQSLAAAFFRADAAGEQSKPRFDLLPHTLDAYQTAVQEFPENHSVKQAYEAFLQGAILACDTFNRPEQAQHLFELLQVLDPDTYANTTLNIFVAQHKRQR